MSRTARYAATVLGSILLVVVTLLTVGAAQRDDAPAPVADGDPRLVRDDSHVLGEEGRSAVTFVEFLDFECEACRATYPAVEQLREEYAGQVTFVIRYFPMPGHVNAERAARSVEAAAQQDRFEDMVDLMYQTQEQWAEQQVPLDDVFRSFAQDLGLDMDAYDQAYADPATAARVRADQEDGLAVGVQGTPTFFVAGRPLAPRTYDDLTDALDAALTDAALTDAAARTG